MPTAMHSVCALWGVPIIIVTWLKVRMFMNLNWLCLAWIDYSHLQCKHSCLLRCLIYYHGKFIINDLCIYINICIPFFLCLCSHFNLMSELKLNILYSGKHWPEKTSANLVNWWPTFKVFSLEFTEYSISVYFYRPLTEVF